MLVDLLAHDENGKSVIAARDRAAVLVDRVGDDPVLGPAIRALSNAGAETVADLRCEIAAWFDEGMNRVSGWYRRRAQRYIFLIGAVVAGSANASTLHVVRDLWDDDALRYALAQQAVAVAGDAENSNTLQIQVPDAVLASFPLGWEGVSGWGVGGWVTHLFGWLFTAATVSLGAPFWFDLLSRVAKLRGTGGRPGGGG